jgi:hypothetical protein
MGVRLNEKTKTYKLSSVDTCTRLVMCTARKYDVDSVVDLQHVDHVKRTSEVLQQPKAAGNGSNEMRVLVVPQGYYMYSRSMPVDF